MDVIQESSTVAPANLVAGYKQQGEDIISFGAGEPDFDTPVHIKPAGTFYAFPNVAAYYNKKDGIATSLQFCEYLLKTQRVAVVSGNAFGMDDHIRLSFSVSMKQLQPALDRIHEGLLAIERG